MALDMQAAVKIKATVDGLASVEGLERGLNKLDRQATGLQGNFGRLRGIAGGLGSALGSVVPAIGLAGLAAFGKRSIDAADNLNDLNQRTGVAVETLDKFGKAANDSGSSLDEVAKAMGKLAKGIVDPASKASEALKSIGVSSTDAQGKIRGVDAIMLDLADKFSKMPDGVQKTALAMELFGKSGSNIIPMLNEGKDALNEYSATIDGKMAAAADKFNDSINKVTSSISGPFNQAVTALLPTITKLAEGIAAAATGFSKLPEPVQTIIGGIAGLAAAFVVLAPAINAIVGIFTVLGGLFAGGGVLATIAGYLGGLGPVVAAVSSALSGLGTVLAGVFTGPVGWVALLVAAGVAIYAFKDQIGAAFTAIGEVLKRAATFIYDMFIKPFMGSLASLLTYVNETFIKPMNEAFVTLGRLLYAAFDLAFIIPFKAAFAAISTFLSENFIEPLKELFTVTFAFISTNFIEPLKELFSTVTTYIAENFIKPVQTGISNFATAAYKYINTNFIEPAKKVFTAVTTFINQNFIKPVQDTITGMIKNIGNAFQSLKEAIVAPFRAAMDIVKGIVNNILSGIVKAISFMIAPINAIIAHANKLGNITRQPQIPYLQPPQFPKFAQGGVVDSPTLAMVGEGNEREYIIPESKMARASANYLGGMRGNAAIQSQGSSRPSSPTIQIQTGPVLQQNNQQYVTIADMEKALTMLTDSLLLNNRTFGGRSYQGVGA
jgi:TP901 family phage tail tape measure protein